MACGSSVHPRTTQAIIAVESGRNAHAIHDNRTGKSYFPEKKEEALKIARDLLNKGHSIDIGLMQINSIHLKTRNINYEKLFDPCTNIKTGTTILSEFYEQHKKNNPKDHPDVTLLKSLSSYNTGTPYAGVTYIDKILKNSGSLAEINLQAGRPSNTITIFKKEDNL